MRLLICDGTHTRVTAFRHIVLLAVTFDGNNQVVILAMAIVSVENAWCNWVCFKECLDGDFPGYDVWMSDADKGIRSNAFPMSVSQDNDDGGNSAFALSQCARHLAENCREACKGAMNEDHKKRIINLAKARTRSDCLPLKQSTKNGLFIFTGSLSNECASFSFLQRGHKRYGKVTSDGVENINFAISDAHSFPIVQMIEAIVKHQRDKFASRKAIASVWTAENKMTTQCAIAEDRRLGSIARKRDIELFAALHQLYKGRVSVSEGNAINGHVEVTVDVSAKVVKCPCLHFEEFGCPCAHGKALLLRIDEDAGLWCGWCAERCSIATYKACHGCAVPGLTTAGKLCATHNFVPPDHGRAAGRPAKKWKDRSWMRTASKHRECKACGELGHFATACSNPSTQHRFLQCKSKAIEWCETNETVILA